MLLFLSFYVRRGIIMKLQMSTNNLDKTRWIALIAAIILMSTLAYSNTWSLMVNPMIEFRGGQQIKG